MTLTDQLERHAREASSVADPAHDFGHVARVVANAERIAKAESASQNRAEISRAPRE